MSNFDNITVGGSATVQEILAELGLQAVPKGCEFSLSDVIDINITTAKSELLEELSDDMEQRSCEALRAGFEEIRKGDFVTALRLFARTFDDNEMAAIETALRGPGAGGRLPSLAAEPIATPRLAAA